jgi:hypothetical protein
MKTRLTVCFISLSTLFCNLGLHAQIRRCANPNPSYTVPENRSFRKPAGTVISVPVIFHVIYGNSGNGNVSESQLQRQIDTLNATHGRAGSQFSFYLAAITRTQKTQWWNVNFYSRPDPPKYEQPSQTEIEMTDTLAIDPKHAFNVYVDSLALDPWGYQVFGWVINFPWQVPEDSRQNGVIIDYRSLPGGSYFLYNWGYTAVHEGGHYLGLYHTFENGCTPPGDEVDDTPYQFNGNNVTQCNDDLNTCPDPEYDPVRNFMNYTDDYCMDHFTNGQSGRASSITGQYRPSLGGTTLEFSSTYTVKGGRSLKIFPGIMLKFATGTSLVINGTLDAVGTSSQRMTFDRIGSSGT